MSIRRKEFIEIMKKKLMIIIAMVIFIIICMSYALYLMSKNNNYESVLVDVLGRQRMLTQMMAKDAHSKYVAMQALKNGAMVYSDEMLKNKISHHTASLKEAKSEFDRTLSVLNEGVLTKDNLRIDFKNSIKHMQKSINDTNLLWSDFGNSVNIVINSNEVDKPTAQALIFISDENERLLGYCDSVTQDLISITNKASNGNMAVALTLFSLSLAALLYFILNLQKYIVTPLNELYKGISAMNMIKSEVKVAAPAANELKPLITEITDGFNKLNNLNSLIKNLNENTSFNEVLEYIYTSFSAFIPYSHIGIALLKGSNETLEASYGISDPSISELPKKLLGLSVKVDKTSLGSIISKGEPRVINDLEEYVKGRPESEYNKIIMEAGIKSSVTFPLKLSNKPVGIIFFSSKEKNIYQHEHIEFLETLADSIAISLNQNIFIDELLYSGILALAKLAESRDEDTGEHLERMKIYAGEITEYLLNDSKYSDRITVSFIRDIKRFSPMHDIGKVGIRDGILLKPGKLTSEEFEEMKRHASFGADVLKTAENNIEKQGKIIFQMGIEIAEAHHEKWDGSGYPYGKSGEEIPLSARIVAIADVLDALTSKRSYKDAFSFEESFDIIVSGSGKHFDPEIIQSIIKHKSDLYKVYQSFSSNNVKADTVCQGMN